MAITKKLEQLQAKVNEKPEKIKGIEKVYQIELTGGNESTLQVIFANEKVNFIKGIQHQPACILKLSEQDFHKLLDGDLNPTAAFMTGKLKIEGEVGEALKLQSIINAYQ
ncbi:SCP2 sterol-binding domain-containing protein [Salsuginibacillus kocurii]|uniref:SCP2 sterol-binding domain-containing protein n=1 Tax=Salsuginibacillus kocurii TaxID=427078 RepID=UPI00036EE50C|nr:SCP2 sterol-binding domain-containing protein [Salsuginibacillus kocurii]